MSTNKKFNLKSFNPTNHASDNEKEEVWALALKNKELDNKPVHNTR
jgi:hypothetical protein